MSCYLLLFVIIIVIVELKLAYNLMNLSALNKNIKYLFNKQLNMITSNDYNEIISNIKKNLLPLVYKVDSNCINQTSSLFNFTSATINQSCSPNIFTIQVTGGASSILNWLISTPGCSRSLMKATVPYATSSLRDILSINEVKLYCSEEIVIKLAKKGFQECCSIYLKETNSFQSLAEANIFSIACTASLATTRPKLGPHHSYLATYNYNKYQTKHFNLKKNFRTRDDEDIVTSLALFNMIAEQSDIPIIEVPLYHSRDDQTNDIITSRSEIIEDIFQDLYQKDSEQITLIPKTNSLHTITDNKDLSSIFFSCNDLKYPNSTLIYSGSFNPIHEGHIKLVASALKTYYNWEPHSNQTNPLVVFEISALNADKPSIPKDEIIRRIITIAESKDLLDKWNITNYAISITSEPLFINKSKLFKENTFLIGADTMTRLINTKYYKPANLSNNASDKLIEQISFANMISALNLFTERKNRFIVGGRIRSDENNADYFETLDTIINNLEFKDILHQYQNTLFYGLSEDDFRADLSSTDIRKGIKNKFLY